MLKVLLKVAPDSVMAEEALHTVVVGKELLKLGRVVQVIALLWVPHLHNICLVECRVQGGAIQHSQGLSQDALSRGNLCVWGADDTRGQVQAPVMIQGDGHHKFIPACTKDSSQSC